jgi:ribulose-5-phosphate 4-epimerase/fuculose-1-phosphate aldolase
VHSTELPGSVEALEGVIKFAMQFEEAPPPDPRLLALLNAWRTVLHRLSLTACEAGRYDGLAYGNLSMRVFGEQVADQNPLFLISGTQTGGLAELSAEHYCWVVDYSLRSNWLHAIGPIGPSSEALTHAAVYDAEPTVNCAIHVHCPEIWLAAQRLEIPVVAADIPYGTPEMALAIAALVRRHPSAIVAMRGHQDGIISYGPSIEETAVNLIRMLARAFELFQEGPSPLSASFIA